MEALSMLEELLKAIPGICVILLIFEKQTKAVVVMNTKYL
jgi:hypothetical protein